MNPTIGTDTIYTSSNRNQLKISNVDAGEEYHRGQSGEQRRSSRASRRDRIQPVGGHQSRPMNEGVGGHRGSKYDVNAGYDDGREYSSNSMRRNSKDLSLPPTASAAKCPPQGQSMPDFITQTDANGNYTTPRSESAIQGARKMHPTGRRPNLHVDKRGQLSEDDSDDENDDDKLYSSDDPCDALLETLRTMCCCFMEDSKSGKYLTEQATEESDDVPRLLGKLHPDDAGKKCLVLDLDETLVHSSFRAVPNADFVIPVQVRPGGDSVSDSYQFTILTLCISPQIEDVVHFVYVIKRPGVDEFLVEMAKHYELVIYTASLNKYADPLLDLLDPKRVIRTRLFRESCVYYQGSYVKDLSLLNRDLSETIIIDNSPNSYMFHPENAIDCSSFIDDPRDRELDQIGAFLKGIKNASDVRGVAPLWRDWPNVHVIEDDDEEPQR